MEDLEDGQQPLDNNLGVTPKAIPSGHASRIVGQRGHMSNLLSQLQKGGELGNGIVAGHLEKYVEGRDKKHFNRTGKPPVSDGDE